MADKLISHSTSVEDSELALAARLKKGDESALADLLQLTGGKLKRLLHKQLGSKVNSADIDDAMSIALFKLWAYRDRYDSARCSLSGWFYLIARHAAIEALRATARRRAVPIEDVSEIEAPRSLGSAALKIPQSPAADAMHNAIAALSEHDRRLLLFYVEYGGTAGWTFDLAKELGVSPGAIRVRRFRLFDKLRKQLQSLVNR